MILTYTVKSKRPLSLSPADVLFDWRDFFKLWHFFLTCLRSNQIITKNSLNNDPRQCSYGMGQSVEPDPRTSNGKHKGPVAIYSTFPFLFFPLHLSLDHHPTFLLKTTTLPRPLSGSDFSPESSSTLDSFHLILVSCAFLRLAQD